MKTKGIGLLLMLILAGTAVGCKKNRYAKRIVGSWTVTYWGEDGQDKTNDFYLLFDDYVVTFNDDNTFVETYNVLGNSVEVSGTYSIDATNLDYTDSTSVIRQHTVESLSTNSLNMTRGNEEFRLAKR